MSFEARYAGWCSDCDDRIHEGDQVTYADDTGTLVHLTCDTSNPPARIADVCGTCWLTKPCECEDQ